jgi:hypothetical protein
MWTARMDLGIAQPDSAMPYMKRILAILDELRLAHRYYLRGLMKPVEVNIARVRMTGTDEASVGKRDARAELADAQAALAARLDRVAVLARSNPAVAADSLTFIRVSALRSAPRVADALEEAIARLRGGKPLEGVLARARRALEPRSSITGGVAEWAGVIP